MRLDLRTPIGWLFVFYGLLLLGFGIMNHTIPASHIGADIAWGAVLLAFGVLVLLARGSNRHG
jgi:hypothetical protein